MIKLPLYRDRYLRGLLYSFILSMNRKAVDIEILGDDIVIKNRMGGEVTNFIADVFNVAYEKCGKKGIKIRFSGNDNRYIYPKILNELSLHKNILLCDVLNKVENIIRNLDDERFMELFYNKRCIAPLSILRLEHYSVGRLPYFNSLDMNRKYPNSNYAPLEFSAVESLMLLAGYILGKCGEAYRGDTRASLLILPTHIYSDRTEFYRLINIFIKDHPPPGLEPEYSLYLWLLMTLPRELESVDVYGVSEPAGTKPSGPVFETGINMVGLDNMINVIKLLISNYKDDILYILRYSLSKVGAITEVKDFASKYAKYIYQIISPDYEACRDLLYISSRDYLMLQRYLTYKKKDKYTKIIEVKVELARRSHRISKGLIKRLSNYRVPSL